MRVKTYLTALICSFSLVACGGGNSGNQSGQGQSSVVVALRLNDTGITTEQCYAPGSSVLVQCATANAMQLNASQDGMTGLDVNSDNSDGRGGFSFSLLRKDVSTAKYDRTECVKDNVTGLVWEGKPSTGVRAGDNAYTNFNDGRTGDTSAYVVMVNQMKLCGFTDWRLPTLDELHSLVDYSIVPSLANLKFQIDEDWLPTNIVATSARVDYPGSVYWAGTQNTVYQNWWGSVDFAYSSEKVVARGSANLFHVRLVRGEKSSAVQRYAYSTDGSEVTDAITGLTWRRCSEGQVWSGSNCTGTATVFTHEAALAQAQAQSGWRLPNVKELQTLADLSKMKPAIDKVAFPSMPNCDAPSYCAYWSTTPNVAASRGALTVSFVHGNSADIAEAGGSDRDSSKFHTRLVKRN